MAKHEWGSEARGADDDGDADPSSSDERKVQIENAYFEKLKERLSQGGGDGTGPFESATAEDEKRVPGPVIYNDDGSVYKRP